jgi:hypothetical protein
MHSDYVEEMSRIMVTWKTVKYMAQNCVFMLTLGFYYQRIIWFIN